MAVRFPRFPSWLWGKKKEEAGASDGSSIKSSSGLREPETVKFSTAKAPAAASPSKNKKKWQSREETRVDREHDVVLVSPSDGRSLSRSDSNASDWSVGWLEPHGLDFLSDDEIDDSFAVLVPCYRNTSKGLIMEGPNHQLLGALKNLTEEHFTDGNQFIEQWLTSRNNC